MIVIEVLVFVMCFEVEVVVEVVGKEVDCFLEYYDLGVEYDFVVFGFG